MISPKIHPQLATKSSFLDESVLDCYLMKILSFDKVHKIVLLSAFALTVSGCAEYNKWASPYGLDVKPVEVFETNSDADRRLHTPKVQTVPPPPAAVEAPQKLTPQPEIKPVETVTADNKVEKPKKAAVKKKKSKKKTVKKKKKAKLPPCAPAASTPAPEPAPVPQQPEAAKEAPVPKVEQTEQKEPEKRERWCYSTLGEPECFSSPQPNAAERLINVDPPSLRPETRKEYQDRVSKTATKSQ